MSYRPLRKTLSETPVSQWFESGGHALTQFLQPDKPLMLSLNSAAVLATQSKAIPVQGTQSTRKHHEDKIGPPFCTYRNDSSSHDAALRPVARAGGHPA
ncbi:protein of unknown function [Agrobacterium pusense]|uniref:Uncharacterized protein n=1 Tax=Agrobacterium pusense TaxID=648995 RepID=U4Q5U9_9HYPH|nr:protein of unknown function [Agrobacterium pusense]